MSSVPDVVWTTGNQRKRVSGMGRRPVAAVAAVLLILEAVGIAALNWLLGVVVQKQHMSLAHLDPHLMTVSTWIGGVLFGLYLLSCALVLLRIAVRDRAPGRFSRIALISCAVVHGVIGALSVGLVGWTAFLFLMVVLGLIVLCLIAYGEPGEGSDAAGAAAPGGDPVAEAPGANPA